MAANSALKKEESFLVNIILSKDEILHLKGS